MNRIVKYLQSIRKWTPYKQRMRATKEELMGIVDQEVESNQGIVLVAQKFGSQIRSRTVYVPLPGEEGILVRRVGRRCQVRRGSHEFDIDVKEFGALWRRCTEKNYKFILK